MNKTVTANISGIVFHIETDAYEKLHQYLSTIRRYFNDSDGTEEIMADIEARIAELFKEKLGLGRDVITMHNVQHVIEVMGEPEQYMDEESSENYSSTHANPNNYQAKRTKKLYRDEDDSMVGGVCSGLGYYFGIDRIWIRAFFLIVVFAGFGTGIPIYIILWIIMPTAKTTGEKLEMRGEPINVENIGNTIKDEFNSFKKKVDGKPTEFARKTERGVMSFFEAIGKVLYIFLKVLSKVIAIALIIFPLIALVGLITILVGGPINMQFNNYDISSSWTTDMAELIFSSPNMFYIGLTGLCIVTIIPILGLIYAGLRILFEIPSSNKVINASAISLLVVGVIMLFVSGTTTVAQYSNGQRQYQDISLQELGSDTLILSSLNSTFSEYSRGIDEFYIEGDQLFNNDFSIDVTESKGKDIVLQIKKEARGRNRREAGRRAENIEIDYELVGNELKVSPLISSPYEDRYRDQEARMHISLPIGKTIYLSPSSLDIIYNIKNRRNIHDRYMTGHYWKMTRDGLVCTDCKRKDDLDNDDREFDREERRKEERLREERFEEDREFEEEGPVEYNIDTDGTSIKITI